MSSTNDDAVAVTAGATSTLSSTNPDTVTDTVTVPANPVLQEALGVTVAGTCLRHPEISCLVGDTILCCALCLGEEKSMGIQQRKSMAAVIQQVQSMPTTTDQSTLETEKVPCQGAAQGTAQGTGVAVAVESLTMPLLQQQPVVLESLLKRLAQVQNWNLRQKENQVLSLQLHIFSLEQQLSDYQVTVQEQSQTVRALRRTIQQDLKIIKTMAMQKEQLDAAVERMVMNAQEEEEEQEEQADDYEPAEEEEDEAGLDDNVEDGTATPLDASPQKSPLDLQDHMPGTRVTLHSPPKRGGAGRGGRGGADGTGRGGRGAHGTGTGRGRGFGPMARNQPVLQQNLGRFKSAPLSAMAQMAASLQMQGTANGNNGSSNFSPEKKSILQTPSPDHNKMGLKAKLMGMDQNKNAVAGKRSGRRPVLENPSNNHANTSSTSSARGPPASRRALSRTLSSDGLDFSMPIPENSDHQPDAFFGATSFAGSARASSYWNDEDVDLAHNPSKMFASFRGGLLDIPKSPPAARHDNSNKPKQKAKLTLDMGMMDTLRTGLPVMRGLTSGPSTVESIPSKKKMPNPPILGLLALQAKLQALPLAHNDDPDTPKTVESGGASPAKMTTATTTTASNLLPPPLVPTFGDDDADDANANATDKTALYVVEKAESQDNYGDPGIYTGTILASEGIPQGKGLMTYKSGRVYEGDWSHGQWNGKGKLLNPNGDVYEGDFVLDARHGKGLYKWDNGDVYVGDFSQDARDGQGKFIFHNGNIYEGEFNDGMFDGYGQYDFADGSYEGEWKLGRYDGEGKLTYATGGMYTGEFRNSVAHGFGVEVTADGKERKGVWDNGEPVEFERKE